ncbi:MAG: DUF5752 family protein [Desulfomonilia bacterium]|nr:DUF5752 family protein [Desulfomonilia bacterium]
MKEPFAVKDCALIALATGEQAQNLRELRDRLQTTRISCIYYHFWGGLLRPRFDDPEYQNDFSIWVSHSLHDKVLAERLALINPTDFEDLEGVRGKLIDVIEDRLDETGIVPWANPSQRFYFVRSQIVVFDTGTRILDPEDLGTIMPHLSAGSIFYHFIDARRRTPLGNDDFHEWLMGFGERFSPLIRSISAIDPYFTTLTDLRTELSAVLKEYLQGGKA